MPLRVLMSLSNTSRDFTCASEYGYHTRPVGVSRNPGLTISIPMELEFSQVRPIHSLSPACQARWLSSTSL